MKGARLEVLDWGRYTAAVALAAGLIAGCAPLPPVEETAEPPAPAAQEPTLSAAQRDSLIKVNRSFAFENWKNRDFESARRQLGLVRQYDLEHQHNIYRIWADCFINLGLTDSAKFAYEEGLRYFPNDDLLHNNLAILLRNRGEVKGAIREMKEAVRIEPENLDYLRELERLYEAAEDWENAIATYERIVALAPNDAALRDALTALIRTRRSPEEYLKTLREAVDQFPSEPERRKVYAKALLDQGDNQGAIEQLNVYLEARPDDLEARQMLGWAYQGAFDLKKALQTLEQLTAMQPDNLQASLGVGQIYLQMGEWAKARKWANIVLSREASYGPAWLLMADVYYRAANQASGDSPKYDDKLVFAIAYGLYEKAARSSDPQSRADGERMMKSMKAAELVPTKEERFMNRRKVRPSGEVYSWIDLNWPEVGYIDAFLKTLD